MSTHAKPPSRTADQFLLRFPDGMRDRIAAEATKNNRSMNAEIALRLQESLDLSGTGASGLWPDDRTLDLFAEKVGQVLDERERKRGKR